jgi:hypothetical protein
VAFEVATAEVTFGLQVFDDGHNGGAAAQLALDGTEDAALLAGGGVHRQLLGREFGVKAFLVTNNRRAPGALIVLHARALLDNPYDGHSLRDVIERTEVLTAARSSGPMSTRGYDAQNLRRVFISGV